MKRLTRPSCFLLLVLLSTSVAALVLLFAFVLVARSNRIVAYFMFNFIGLVIIRGFLRSAKPITTGDIDEMFYVPPSPEHIDHQIMLIEEENKEGGDIDDDEDDEYHSYDGYEEDNNDDMEAGEDDDSDIDDDEDDEYHSYDGYEEDNNDDMEAGEDDDSEAEEGDSDLERRSEQFIAKMNGTWRNYLLQI